MTALSCPGCSASMREFDVGSHQLDRCTFCRGLWFDGGELQAVLGKRPKAELTMDQSSSRKCPRCAVAMRPAIVGGLRVEFCETCSGVFLDDGELTALNGGTPVRVQASAPRADAAVSGDVMGWLDSLGK